MMSDRAAQNGELVYSGQILKRPCRDFSGSNSSKLEKGKVRDPHYDSQAHQLKTQFRKNPGPYVGLRLAKRVGS